MDVTPTVIARFLAEVDAELRRHGAAGAAEHMASRRGLRTLVTRGATRRRAAAAAVARRSGCAQLDAADDRDSARRRAKRVLPPTLPGGAPRDAQTAAGQIGGLRDLLRQRPTGALAATPTGVAGALASVQLMLRHIADGDPTRPDTTAVIAVPHAARGLVACFQQGASFPDGIPGETRATVAVLDGLDDERTIPWGARGQERTAHQSDLHRTLVRSLISALAMDRGEVTHADDAGTLPVPRAVGRHRPDLAGRSPAGELFLGEAKVGPELFDDHSQEQLADFIGFAADGDPVAVHLVVPEGWREEAERAARQAAGSTTNLVVPEVGGLPGVEPVPRAAAVGAAGQQAGAKAVELLRRNGQFRRGLRLRTG